MRKLLAGAAVAPLALASLPAAAAPVFFDDFTVEQRGQDNPSSDNPQSTTQAFGSGTRTLTANIMSEGDGREADVVIETGERRNGGGGTLAYSEVAAVTGLGTVDYEGMYDFSRGRSFDIEFINTDNPFDIALEVEDADSDMSLVERFLDSSDNMTTQSFSFASFDSNIDFGNLSRFSLLIDNEDRNRAVDAQFGSISVSQVPVPAAGILLVGGLGALGFLGRRRTA